MSTIKPLKFTFRPSHVLAVPVTKDNMQDVAEWCGGEVLLDGQTIRTPYIKVKVKRALTERRTMAFVGDWVVKGPMGWKVYLGAAFEKEFVRFVEDPCGLTTHTINNQPCVLGKGHRQGKVVTDCRSLRDYKIEKMDDVLGRLGYDAPNDPKAEPWSGISDEMATTPIAQHVETRETPYGPQFIMRIGDAIPTQRMADPLLKDGNTFIINQDTPAQQIMRTDAQARDAIAKINNLARYRAN